MKQVWKYSLATFPEGIAEIEMPAYAEVVHVGLQDRTPTIWAVVDPDAKRKELRRFKIYGTGHGIRENAKHVGTWFQGPYVWHLFEIERGSDLKTD